MPIALVFHGLQGHPLGELENVDARTLAEDLEAPPTVPGHILAGKIRAALRGAAEGEKPPRIITPEEAAAILARCELDDTRLGRSFAAPLYALAFGSGLRLGELLALRWGN